MKLKKYWVAIVIISREFNRFMHGVVIAKVQKIRILNVREIKGILHPFYLSKDTLKQLLKIIDLDYPRNNQGEPLSYTKLSELEFLSHIAFIERICAENNINLEL